MKFILYVILIFVVFGCKSNPANSDLNSNDNEFISDLLDLHEHLERDSLMQRIVITDINEGNYTYNRIVEIDFSNLGLYILPASIINLSYLEELNLSNNEFTDFPEELCSVYSKPGDQAVAINIDNNQLCDPEVITLCILDEVKMDFEKQGCEKIKYDQDMDFLLQLIKDNQLDSVSTNIFDGVEWSWEKSDSSLTEDGKQIERIIDIRWINSNLTSIPSTISDLEFITELELEDNKLSTLPTEFKYLTKLKNLQLQNNVLIALPAFIGEMKSLQTLNVSNNQITALPNSIGTLDSLIYLNLGKNLLTTLPDELCTLRNFNEDDFRLNIECNQLGDTGECWSIQLGSQGSDPQCSSGD